MGNSEVGHMNIGASRVVFLDLPKIDKPIAEGDFAANAALGDSVAKLKTSGGTAHLMGLLSPGGVHARQRHIAEAAKLIAAAGVPVAIHAFLDGRDTPPRSALGHMSDFIADLGGAEGISIASTSGRFFALDRDKRWERVSQAFDVIVAAKARAAASATAAIEMAYEYGESDEFVLPTAIAGYDGAQDGDGVLFVNFRADRAREVLSALGDPDFSGFDVATRPDFAALCGIVEHAASVTVDRQ